MGLILDREAETVKSRNLVAQTNTGSSNDVVMVGEHLDSAAGGPGINDNGSGVDAQALSVMGPAVGFVATYAVSLRGIHSRAVEPHPAGPR